MLVNELESLTQVAHALCQFFLHNPTIENGIKLEESLSKLVHGTSSIEPTARISVDSVGDFLHECKLVFVSVESSHSTRSRLSLLFFNLSLYNTQIRRYLCGDLQICEPIFYCLQTLVRERLGPQNIIDSFRLLQLLTYEKCLPLGSWINDMLIFLIDEVLRVDSSFEIEANRRNSMDHPLPYCMTILCNLVARSKVIANKIKKMTNFKNLLRRLLDFLQNNSRTVVVCSLVLIGYLDEKMRDTIFSPQNISQSFLCIFNVLGCADSLMTIRISVNLLKRLVISTSGGRHCTLTATAKNLASYPFFQNSIQRTASLLSSMDPRSEEVEAIFDLLLSFCKVGELRRAVCLAIVEMPKSGKRFSTPFATLARIAFMSFADAIRSELPLHALRMLTLLICEAIDEGVKVCDCVSSSTLCNLVESSVKSAIETKSSLAKQQCIRVREGLRLAEAIANDEDARNDLLNVVNASLCAHINESQLISNPIVGFVNQLKSSTKCAFKELPEWSLSGVSISLQLLRLLATLKDYSKMHKDLYWRSLKDERIVPFIAFAISQDDDELVYDAFVLFTHCAQVQDFPIRRLSEIVSMCTHEMKLAKRDDVSFSSAQRNRTSCESLSDCGLFADIASTSHEESSRQIDELVAKMKDGIDLKDARTSQLIFAFEKKIAMHLNRERELKQLITIKEQALAQSQRLQSICQERDNSEELSNLRVILSELKRQLAEGNTQLKSVEAEKKECAARVAKLKQVLETERSQRCAETENFQREKAILLDENEKERELQTVLRKRFDEITAKFDIATKTILDKQQELDSCLLRVRDSDTKLLELQQKLDELTDELATSRNMLKTQSEQIEQRNEELKKLADENKKLLRIKQAMTQMLSD